VPVLFYEYRDERDDMGGVGSILRDGKTLYVGRVGIYPDIEVRCLSSLPRQMVGANLDQCFAGSCQEEFRGVWGSRIY
jgi:hypothetical protein